jgi:hypothetical protein
MFTDAGCTNPANPIAWTGYGFCVPSAQSGNSFVVQCNATPGGTTAAIVDSFAVILGLGMFLYFLTFFYNFFLVFGYIFFFFNFKLYSSFFVQPHLD